MAILLIIISLLGYGVMLSVKYFKGMCGAGWGRYGKICGDELLILIVLVFFVTVYSGYYFFKFRKKESRDK